MKYFFSHLIEIESLIVKLDELDLTDEQKLHLSSLVDSTIHQTILDLVLSKLSVEDKKIFIKKLEESPEDKELMDFLVGKVDNIEDEISKTVKELKEELHEDLKGASNL